MPGLIQSQAALQGHTCSTVAANNRLNDATVAFNTKKESLRTYLISFVSCDLARPAQQS